MSNIVLQGKINLTASTIYKADSLIIKADVEIVTNGYPLMFDSKTLEIDSQPHITAFLPRTNRPAGENGRDANAITIRAKHIKGGHLAIDNSGEDGTMGAPGAKGHAGTPGAQGQQPGWDPLAGCHGGTNGTPGGQGGIGAQGQTGGNGGRGGDVIATIDEGLLDSAATQIVIHSVSGGQAGNGGQGGPGGDGGAGGPGAPGTSLCGGTNGAGPGPAGPHGPQGMSGQQGPDGRIYILK